VWPSSHQFRRGRKVAEVNGNVSLADEDFLGDIFYDFTFLFTDKVRPAGIEVSGLIKHLVAGKVLDFEEIYFTLQFRYLIFGLLESFF
jgi:hypothetical protein